MTRPKTNAQELAQPVVRYEAGGLQVELERDHVVLIPLAPAAEQEKQALLRQLAERPRLVVALAESGAGGIAKLLPADRAPGAPGGVRCACGDPGCARLAPALAAARAAWAADAELRLRQLGWTREALLAAVWAAWAAEAPLADAEAALRRAAGPRGARREAAGPGGPPLAERLAEAAEQGRLHQPGPEFHDVDVELGPAARRRQANSRRRARTPRRGQRCCPACGGRRRGCRSSPSGSCSGRRNSPPRCGASRTDCCARSVRPSAASHGGAQRRLIALRPVGPPLGRPPHTCPKMFISHLSTPHSWAGSANFFTPHFHRMERILYHQNQQISCSQGQCSLGAQRGI
ncbi:hypothetical protein NSQ80_03060 [Paenibacillus sp. FSL K6-2441]|uniref:hypothetical protein n=1 Tax=Paenibacillus sp. FSL K6-2441 TaxID=2954679 RepID=UPI0030D778D9